MYVSLGVQPDPCDVLCTSENDSLHMVYTRCVGVRGRSWAVRGPCHAACCFMQPKCMVTKKTLWQKTLIQCGFHGFFEIR